MSFWLILSQLSGRATMTNAVQLIPLKPARLPTSSKCLTAGWGDVGDNNTLPARLQEVNVTTLSQQSCRRRWRLVPIARTMVCGVGEADFQGFCSVRSSGLTIHQVWREFKGCACKYCSYRLHALTDCKVCYYSQICPLSG